MYVSLLYSFIIIIIIIIITDLSIYMDDWQQESSLQFSMEVTENNSKKMKEWNEAGRDDNIHYLSYGGTDILHF